MHLICADDLRHGGTAIDRLPSDLLDFVNHFLRSHQCVVDAENQQAIADIIVARLLVAPIDHAALPAMIERQVVFVPSRGA